MKQIFSCLPSLLLLLFGTLQFLCPIQCFNENKPLNTSLAQQVDRDPTLYWRQLTDTWLSYEQSKSSSIWNHWRQVKNATNQIENVSSECLNIVEHMMQHPAGEEWTAKMLNSMSTSPAGLLSGTTAFLGDFDQCQATSGTFKGQSFVGKYCMATVGLPKMTRNGPLLANLSSLQQELPSWTGKYIRQWYHNDEWYDVAAGVCFPSICKPEEVRSLLQSYYPILQSFEFNVSYCQAENEPAPYSFAAILSCTVVLLVSFFVLVGTLFELLEISEYINLKDYSWGEAARGFSVVNNTSILFSIDGEKKEEEEQFQYVHGVRSFVSFIVIYFHATHYTPVKFAMKVSVLAHHPHDLSAFNVMIQNHSSLSHVLVQAFFVMSGMLLTYNTLSRKKIKLNFVLYVIVRWLRYTPSMLGTLFFMFIAIHQGSGPYFSMEMNEDLVAPCRSNWWRNLLYIHNFDKFDEMCFPASWYLAGEMQLHVLAFILFIVYLKSSRLTYLTSGAFIATGFFSIVIISSKASFQHSLLNLLSITNFRSVMDYFQLFHTGPWMYFISYFIGCIVGQVLLEKAYPPIPPSVGRFLMLLSWVILFTLPFMRTPFLPADNSQVTGTNYLMAFTEAGLYLCASLSSGWLMYFGATNPDSIFTRFFAAKIFQPISRLSFTMYLVHTVVIWYNANQSRTPISVVNYEQMSKVLSTTYWHSMFWAYIIFLTFEAPFVNVLKVIFDARIKAAAVEQRQERLEMLSKKAK